MFRCYLLYVQTPRRCAERSPDPFTAAAVREPRPCPRNPNKIWPKKWNHTF
eukprot:SAG11_NODE_35912_length_264_cov_0.933333_1_plen_50_part_01